MHLVHLVAGVDHTAVDPRGDPSRGLAGRDPPPWPRRAVPDPLRPPLLDPGAALNVRGDCDQVRVAAPITQLDRPPGRVERASEVQLTEPTLSVRDQLVPHLGALRLRLRQPPAPRDPSPRTRELPFDRRNVPQIERAPHGVADVTGVDVNLIHALQQACGFVASTQDVRALDQSRQVVDRQGRNAVDHPERVAAIRPHLPAVVLPSPFELRDRPRRPHLHSTARPTSRHKHQPHPPSPGPLDTSLAVPDHLSAASRRIMFCAGTRDGTRWRRGLGIWCGLACPVGRRAGAGWRVRGGSRPRCRAVRC